MQRGGWDLLIEPLYFGKRIHVTAVKKGRMYLFPPPFEFFLFQIITIATHKGVSIRKKRSFQISTGASTGACPEGGERMVENPHTRGQNQRNYQTKLLGFYIPLNPVFSFSQPLSPQTPFPLPLSLEPSLYKSPSIAFPSPHGRGTCEP